MQSYLKDPENKLLIPGLHLRDVARAEGTTVCAPADAEGRNGKYLIPARPMHLYNWRVVSGSKPAK